MFSVVSSAFFFFSCRFCSQLGCFFSCSRRNFIPLNTTGCHGSHQQTKPLANRRTRGTETEGGREGPALNRGQSMVNNNWMAADNALLYFMHWLYTVSGGLGSEVTQQHVACYSTDALMPTCYAMPQWLGRVWDHTQYPYEYTAL